MRRRLSILVAAALAAATLVTAAPAKAAEGANCALGSPPDPSSVETIDGRIYVYPDRVPNDGVAVALWVLDYVDCETGPTVEQVQDCLSNIGPSGPYVWYDPDTGAVVIDFQRIRDDWFAMPWC